MSFVPVLATRPLMAGEPRTTLAWIIAIGILCVIVWEQSRKKPPFAS